MREVPLTLPEIGMINITRFIIGTGAGLLLAGKLDNKARRAVGFSLITVGSLFSIPVGIAFFGCAAVSHSLDNFQIRVPHSPRVYSALQCREAESR